MDTTPKYILMCERSPRELRDSLGENINYAEQGYCTQHKCFIQYGPDGGHDCPNFLKYIHKLPINQQSDHKKGFGSKHDCSWNNRWIPLYYQDQLQEMVANDIGGNHIALLSSLVQSDLLNQAGLGHYVSSPFYDHTESMEQLWLAFVMKEKYNKIWNGKDWVKT